MQYTVTTLEETKNVATEFVGTLKGGEIIGLEGDLGAGKTTFVQGMAKALGITEPVRSPTYTIVKMYETTHPTIKHLIHADLYRLDGPVDLRSLGMEEWLGRDDVIIVIEWAERLDEKSDIVVSLGEVQSDKRFITIQ